MDDESEEYDKPESIDYSLLGGKPNSLPEYGFALWSLGGQRHFWQSPDLMQFCIWLMRKLFGRLKY